MIQKKAMGDSHNFNRRVSYFEEAGRPLIEKPRCIFWEYLFLDKSSPLRSLLRHDTHVDFDAILGDIKITSRDSFQTGIASFVAESPITDVTSWLHAYGELLGLASVFGITDLHRENVLNIENRPRVIDIECLFWGAELPSETFLLSKNDFEWSKSIWASTPFRHLKTLSSPEVLQVLKGYDRVLEYMSLHAESLKKFFAKLDLGSYPVRLLIERTRDYRKAVDEAQYIQGMFLDEEVEQLERGDIPYFYGYSGQKQIYYFGPQQASLLLKARKPVVEEKLLRAFKMPKELLSSERLLRLKKQGIAEIVARLLNPKTLPFEEEGVKFFIEDSFLKISFKDLALQVKAHGASRG